MGHEIKGAEIFDAGTWNGLTFTQADVESIVTSFNALNLGGRIPLKFGHRGKDAREDDTQPALGWVSRVYREGTKLLADFVDVPSQVYQAIKSGLYKFVSVELLKDVQAGTRLIPWTLDAVALLGATAPAVGTLADLQSLTMARRATFPAAERLSFSRPQEGNSAMTDDIKALHKRAVALLFDSAIREGRIQPRDRHAFERRFGDAGTLDEAEAWIKDTVRPAARGTPGTVATSSPRGERADATLTRMAQDILDEQRAKGRAVSPDPSRALIDAAKVAMTRDPEVAQSWQWATDPDRRG